MWAAILVAAELDQLHGGYSSLALQAGAFGLLTYIVTYLAPRVLKDAREERESRDKNFQEQVDILHNRFEARNTAIVAAVERQTLALEKGIEKQTGILERGLLSVCKAK